MSRYEIPAKDPSRYAVIVGWDKRLQTYFGQVTRKDADRDWDITLWKGTNPREINSVQELQRAVEKYANIPNEVQNALAFDMGPMDYYPSRNVGQLPGQKTSQAIVPDYAEYDR